MVAAATERSIWAGASGWSKPYSFSPNLMRLVGLRKIKRDSVRPDTGGHAGRAHCPRSSPAVVMVATSPSELRITSAVTEAGTPAMASAGTTTR